MRIQLLWFDVEERYNATCRLKLRVILQLWFDVEERYNATQSLSKDIVPELWFDVEERYNATKRTLETNKRSCGLM